MPLAAKDGLKVLRQLATVTDGDGYLQLVKKIVGLEPGVTASSLGKAEDAAHASGDVGVAVLAVRQDSRVVSGGSSGDYSVLGLDAQGNLYVVAAEKRAQLSSSPTVSAASYAAGDVVGGKMSITSAARFSGGSFVVENVVLADKAAALTDVDLWLFGADPSSSTFTDDAAFTIADADLAKVVGVLNLSLAYAAANNGVLQYTPPAGLPVVLASGTTLYGVLVTRAAATLASTSDLTVILTVRQD